MALNPSDSCKIVEATSLLRSSAPQVPPNFMENLFGRVLSEDLSPYANSSLVALASSAFSHLSAPRILQQPAICLIDLEIERQGRKRDVTIVEIINDNMPFLLDSTLAEISDQGYEPLLVAHPILAVERSADGQLKTLHGEVTGGSTNDLSHVISESLIHIHLDRIDDEAAKARLLQGLKDVYADVTMSVHDWEAMRNKITSIVTDYQNHASPLPYEESFEAAKFLSWIASDNFTFLGIREYRFTDGDTSADPVEGTGLGILRDPHMRVLKRGNELVVMSPEIRAFLSRPKALIIAKANVKSRVHRRVHMDYIGVKLFSTDGKLEGELRIVGLFTSSAYTGAPGNVPYLGHKISNIVKRAGFDPSSYAGRALMNVLESYPRDELFQVDEETLYTFALEIMNLSERPRIRALARVDEFDRFVSILVYIPKDRYDTTVRRRVGEFLASIYQGRLSAAYPAYPEGPLSRTHYIIGRDEGQTPDITQDALEQGISAIIRTWSDALRDTLSDVMGGTKSRALGLRYANAFSAAYREAFGALQAIDDIGIIERLSDSRTRAVDLYRREGDALARVNLKVYSRGTALPLSERVPLLENLGFRVINERTYRIAPAGSNENERIWLHDMALERASGGDIHVEHVDTGIEAALLAIFRDLSESDKFDTLVLEAGLGWRDVAMLRTLGRYLRQIRSPFGQDYLAGTLARYGALASKIVTLFYTRFDPRLDTGKTSREAQEADIKAQLEDALKEVASLDDDKILRGFINLIESAVRTNFFQIDVNGMPHLTIAFKFECAKVEGLPLPKPLYEIFIYSPRVEGTHLRFGKVARGGLRWSDRPQDFRTEVLGLVKAQQVKNAVIVPVGAKGGFVPKKLPPSSDRQAWLYEGTESYRIFIRTLLQLTDNIVQQQLVSPADTVRHDGDDPYLVVAADKGTATFSDTANAISLERGHWLGDAFASGGSQGYDHKKMGITAKGAWEAVKRHFREIDVDIQNQSIRVAGVGDMSGDVFGNGVLLSKTLKLVAAFDHRDIFLDPDPDPATSWVERERMFSLPRSSWADYDKNLISSGGGVFSRSLKTIPLSKEVQAVLGFSKSQVSPQEVMNAILKAPVDLLWFGGIGTYIRASSESDEQVGDRANDAIRITGSDLRAKVIGEGANLGLTQKARIEAAQHHVRLNTDAIDNSAGVNTSDVEVNIKIALSQPEQAGILSQTDRNHLLSQMTDDVGELVLRNNYLQTLALSVTESRGVSELGFARRLMQGLEAEGRLDRGVEDLPDETALLERQRKGESLTRPEWAVLVAYAKLALHDALLGSSMPDDPYLAKELERYFPDALRQRFPEAIQGHRLRREIISTQLANAMINRGGPTLVTRLVDQTGADIPTIAAAYASVRDAFHLSQLNAALDALDSKISGVFQLELYRRLQELLLSRLVWFIRNVSYQGTGLETIIETYQSGIAAVEASLDTTLSEEAKTSLSQNAEALVKQGLDPALSQRFARLPVLVSAPDIVLVATQTGRNIAAVSAIHFHVSDLFKLDALVQASEGVKVSDYYDRLARDRSLDTIASAHRRLTSEIVSYDQDGIKALALWNDARGHDVTRIRNAVEGIVASGLTLSKLSVAASLLSDLARV